MDYNKIPSYEIETWCKANGYTPVFRGYDVTDNKIPNNAWILNDDAGNVIDDYLEFSELQVVRKHTDYDTGYADILRIRNALLKSTIAYDIQLSSTITAIRKQTYSWFTVNFKIFKEVTS